MLNNLSGIAGVQQSLEQTNALLAEVLAELKKTNDVRLAEIAEQLGRAAD